MNYTGFCVEEVCLASFLSCHVCVCRKKKPHAMSQKIYNGTVPRSWLICQENRGTFRLRYQLAEDGCTESQVVLAKGLLSEPVNSKEEQFLNAELAVYWLILAAEKGHEEALLLLKECSYTSFGISFRNRFRVEKCLRLTEIEKISHRVGHRIHRSVMSDVEDSIAEDTFQERVQVILGMEKKDLLSEPVEEPDVPDITYPLLQPRVGETVNMKADVVGEGGTEPSHTKLMTKQDTTQNKVTEKPDVVKQKTAIQEKKTEGIVHKEVRFVSPGDVVTSVQQCLEGNVPLVTLKNVISGEEYSKWFSMKYVYWMKSNLYRSLEMLIEDLSSAALPCTVFLLSLFLSGILFLIAPLEQWSSIMDKYRIFVMNLLCLLTMVSCTCYVIFINFGYRSTSKWLELIKIFEPSAKTEEAKRRYWSKTFFPLLTFFFASVPYVWLYAVNPWKYKSSDMCIVYLFFMILIDRTISSSRRHVTISFVLNLLLCAYKFNLFGDTTNGWINFLNFGTWFSFGENYSLHLNCFSCIILLLMLPYLYVRIALGDQRKGWRLALLPHLMSVTWMNLAFTQLAESQTSDLLIGICFWFAVLLIGKYIGTIVSLIVCLGIKFLYLSDGWSSAAILLLLALFCTAYLLSCCVMKSLKSYANLEKYALLLCCVTALVAYGCTSPSATPRESISALSWDSYQTSCHRYAWYQTNTAEVEMACLPLKGKTINFEGTLISVDVVKVENYFHNIASVLPAPFYSWFTCTFGEQYLDCNQPNLPPFKKQRCLLYQLADLEGCHLHNWDVYKFKLTIEVSTRTAPEVLIFANHACLSFIKALKEGDSLTVSGVLHENIGSALPTVLLRKATCNSCYYDNVSCTLTPTMSPSSYDASLRYFTLFYLYPLIQHT